LVAVPVVNAGSMASVQAQISSATVERSGQLALPRYGLLDAHADTKRLLRSSPDRLLWRAHLGCLRDLQRVTREVLGDVA
jgi:hypothetical protein